MNEKKSLSPLAWVGIGCGCLVVIIAVAVIGGGMFIGSKVQEMAEEYGGNPAVAAAVLAIKADPNLELVETDTENGTITILDERTGETTTVNFADLEQGKISFENSDGSFNVEMGDGAEGGGVTITGADGEVFRAGGGGAEDLPEWVLLYPDADVAVGMRTSANDGVAGLVTVTTSDATMKEVLDWYQTSLEDAGFEVKRQEATFGDQTQGILQAETPERSLAITVRTNAEGVTQAGIQYQGKSPQH